MARRPHLSFQDKDKVPRVASQGTSQNPDLHAPLHWFVFHVLSEIVPSLVRHHPLVNTNILSGLIQSLASSLDELIEKFHFVKLVLGGDLDIGIAQLQKAHDLLEA